MVTFTNLERALKSIRDHVDKSRNQWVALEALSTRVEGEENADERAERIALELLRARPRPRPARDQFARKSAQVILSWRLCLRTPVHQSTVSNTVHRKT